MTKELLDIVKILEENDIEAIAFKGPTLSQLAYGDVVSRQYVDLDILIEQKELQKVINILLKNAYKNILPLEIISNKTCLKTIKDFTLQHINSKVNIEIHWSLFEKKYKTFFKKLDISKSDDVLINQNKIKTISKETLLIYLCLHGSKHMWERVEWIVDIDKFIRNNKLDFSKIDNFYDDTSLLLGLYLSYYLFNTPLEERYLKKISNIKIISLAKRVLETMMDEKYQIDEFYRNKKVFYFQISLYDNFFEKFSYYLNTIFKISEEDCQTFHINDKYNIIYIFLRPFRIIKKYLIR